jgi:hypothetical protein
MGGVGVVKHLEYCCNTELPVSEPASRYCPSNEQLGGRSEPKV